jgi:4-alpha-glucanotransferase
MHISSLPSRYGIGDVGPWAYKFADFLEEGKQSLWQMLPLSPVDPMRKNSPYNSCSAFAGNKYLISPDKLLKQGLLSEDDVDSVPSFSDFEVEYDRVLEFKEGLLKEACDRFKSKNNYHMRYGFDEFCKDNRFWLEDFASYIVFNAYFDQKPWNKWPEEIRDRDPDSLDKLRKELREEIDREKILQFIFFHQWHDLKHYCNQKNIQIIGDLPYYVDYDSADVWVHADMFKLKPDKTPEVVSGVPPDYFSENGQLWKNPVYKWDRDKGYGWWVRRIEHSLRLFDMIRIDHFRGFASYWEIPSGEETARHGQWREGPGERFFNVLLRHFPSLPIIAEDLGYITADVRELIFKFDFPGMKVLQFAFGDDIATNPHVPHNLVKNCLIYTGTHDNNTIKGWYDNEASDKVKKRISEYAGKEVNSQNVHWEMIRLAMMSVADYAIFPMQDILGLGSEARINTPSRRDGNWRWRASEDHINSDIAHKLGNMAIIYGRTNTIERI